MRFVSTPPSALSTSRKVLLSPPNSALNSNLYCTPMFCPEQLSARARHRLAPGPGPAASRSSPHGVTLREYLAEAIIKLGTMQELSEALASEREAHNTFKDLLAADANNSLARANFGFTDNAIAEILIQLGQPTAAWTSCENRLPPSAPCPPKPPAIVTCAAGSLRPTPLWEARMRHWRRRAPPERRPRKTGAKRTPGTRKAWSCGSTKSGAGNSKAMSAKINRKS
jgi:hypothetical protein